MELLQRSRYESIVLDCPSTLNSADMTIIADHVDGILLTSLVKHTRRSKVVRSAEVLAPVAVLGTVAMGER
jgi:Mrp family chromosome partitioning ATPase